MYWVWRIMAHFAVRRVARHAVHVLPYGRDRSSAAQHAGASQLHGSGHAETKSTNSTARAMLTCLAAAAAP